MTIYIPQRVSVASVPLLASQTPADTSRNLHSVNSTVLSMGMYTADAVTTMSF